MGKPTYDYDLIVIGSGAAGSVAADIVAAAGKRVAIVEPGELGGTSPNWGAVPVKAMLEAARVLQSAKTSEDYGIRASIAGFNYPSVLTWKDTVIARTGVHEMARHYQSRGIGLYKGAAHFISPHEITVERRHLSAAHFLIATGSSFSPLGLEVPERITPLTPRTALELSKPPRTLFIIGGGQTGVEFAELFSSFGSNVYIADAAPRLLPKEDQEVSSLIEAVFSRQRGIQVLTKTKLLGISLDGVSPRIEFLRGGETHSVRADQVLIASGTTPNTDLGLENASVSYSSRGIETDASLQTSARHIFAAGDVTGTQAYTHTAIYESRLAAHNILHKQKLSVDYRAVPRVTYTTPEIASVGMSEEDCLRRDLPVRTSVATISEATRATVSGRADGLVKIITDKRGVLLGASVVCPHAGEVIHELTLAIQYGMTAAQVAGTLHAYPSWSEAVRIACAKLG
ncbi:MAG TPA: NAD(P)/FAD-dependent oxidoreductase [Candidatus Saccharimonadales bacterium]|jgi:dihydrolipoamide dehydrogenase